MYLLICNKTCISNVLLFSYLGGRKASDIVAWVIKNSGPSTTTLETSEEIKALIEKQDVTIFGYFETLESEEAGAYKAAADSLSDSLTFGLTTNSQAIEDMKADVNSVIVYKKVIYYIVMEITWSEIPF